ncbi:MAG TPA: carboxypeptidase-like regulatory domain-containing protein [Polyangiaceae bacterium]|nr:carboxypeptidase-like regulatory domain-containing protein [Polyangiaceae bacterium]
MIDSSGLAVRAAKVCLVAEGDACCEAANCSSSDSAGKFVVELEHGRARYMIASASGFVALEQDLRLVVATDSIVLRLVSGAANVSGNVRDAAGGALVGARIQATSLAAPGVRSSAWSDAAGFFSLDMPPGAVGLLATVDAYSSSGTTLTAPADHVSLVLEPSTAAIQGQVLSGLDRTEPALPSSEGTRVMAAAANGDRGAPEIADVGVEGRFSFPALPPGAYELVAIGDRGRSAPVVARVGIGETKTVQLVLEQATAVEGVMRVNGESCVRGGVELNGPIWLSANTGEGGAFLLKGVPPGQYAATAHCEGAMVLREPLLVDGAPVHHDFELASGFRIQGSVQGARGQPIANAHVLVQPLSRQQAAAPMPAGASCDSDVNGAFSCVGLPPGEYEVGAWLGEFAGSELVPVTLDTGDAGNILLRVRAFASIRVTTVASGDPPAALAVIARGPRGFSQARRDGETFMFDRLELGAYAVFIGQSRDVPKDARRIELSRDGQVEEVSLALPEARSIAGFVVDGDLAPVSDARVRVSGTDFSLGDEVQTMVLTDQQGAFSIPALLPGRYDLEASNEFGEAVAAAVLAGAQGLRIRLDRLGSLSGDLRDARGAPIPTFTLSYTNAAGETRRVRGSNGEWSLPQLREGLYQLSVTSSDGGRASAEAPVRGGVATRISLVLGADAAQEPTEPLAGGHDSVAGDQADSR